jgi:site-specific recombinase XerD
MVGAGIDIYTVGKIIGHASIVSTQRYAHLADEKLLSAAEAGAARLEGGWSREA